MWCIIIRYKLYIKVAAGDVYCVYVQYCWVLIAPPGREPRDVFSVCWCIYHV